MTYKFFLIATVCTLIAAGCDQNVAKNSVLFQPYHMQDGDKDIYVSIYQYDKEILYDNAARGESLNLLFNKKHSMAWVAEKLGCNMTIQLTLKEPKYVRSVKLYFGNDEQQRYLRPKRILLSAHKDAYIDDPIFGDHLEKQNVSNVVTFSFAGGTFMGVFPVKTILLSVRECFPVTNINKLAFREIEIGWSKKPVYSPRNNLIQIKKKYSATEKSWHVPRSNFSNLISEQDVVLADLAYYALNGSVEADKMFSSYSPLGSMSGEEYMYARDWLEKTKRSKKTAKRGR